MQLKLFHTVGLEVIFEQNLRIKLKTLKTWKDGLKR